ncbi:sulfate transporter CysZ [Alteromonas sediminis]|uniref:Sulfate transporter CysZ n=1 Tax=Alteromonas sediminis TaxID=2259342 RepID=A0A3N5Z9D0_9ALTE|nr:sulfate transporter CysZ [Alteromonas sediminis]RPJ67614.1 sulfate transporter CysZ [Alteromonas sediminis]
MEHGGFHYFISGFTLIRTKGLKRFVFIPMTVNLILFGVAFSWLLANLGESITWLMSFIPEWLGWFKEALAFVLWPLAIISSLLLFAILFGTLANIFAAPFNGLLAEKVERHLTQQPLGDDGFMALLKDVPRMVKREIVKLIYYLPRALVCLFCLLFIPLIGQLIWFLFGAWMMAVQYCDYPFDNHKIGFDDMRNQLKSERIRNVSFGMAVSICSFIPLLNLVVMPVAVCGATALFVDRYRTKGLSPDVAMSTPRHND